MPRPESPPPPPSPAATADRLTARGQGLDAPTALQQLRRLDRTGAWKP
ncbi:hypothetical protein P1P75_28235 [Streptomyces sp. ID05-39B]|nr:hypothetical protein [Streptomyces sp. ID05-39B]MDX3530198.1 hypothetical protein [Streptomyces sp. ID05-39B]